MTLQPETLVRVVRGAHQGRDGKLLSVSHGVCEVESWLDREEILICFAADVVPLAECPPEHVASTSRAIAHELRAVVDKLEAIHGGCVSVADHGAARVVWDAQQNLSSVAGSMVGGEKP